MDNYQTFTLRSPDRGTFIADLKSALSNAGIDPYEKNLLRKDENGEDVINRFLSFIPAGGWWIEKPTTDSEGNLTDTGTSGDYALINGITKDPEIMNLIEGFGASDASTQPSEIASSEKIGGGTHRVDQSTISSPVRTW
jgi:hypothetical protein